MFDHLRKSIYGIGWYLEKDEPGSGGAHTDDSTGDQSEKTDPKAGDDKTQDPNGEKKFSQAEMEAILKDRLDRAQKKSEQAAEKARRDAEQAALEKNQEWQALAETRAKTIADLTSERDQLAPFKDQAERYEQALKSQLAKVKESLPKHLLPLIDRMDPVDQLEYISSHAKELSIQPSSYGETPDPKEKRLTDDEERSAQTASRSVVTNNF